MQQFCPAFTSFGPYGICAVVAIGKINILHLPYRIADEIDHFRVRLGDLVVRNIPGIHRNVDAKTSIDSVVAAKARDCVVAMAAKQFVRGRVAG